MLRSKLQNQYLKKQSFENRDARTQQINVFAHLLGGIRKNNTLQTLTYNLLVTMKCSGIQSHLFS